MYRLAKTSRILDLRQADDVQEGFLLPGERGVGQILGGGRGTHRDRGRGAGHLAQLIPALVDRFLQRRLERRFDYPAPNFAPGLRQRVHITRIERFEPTVDPFAEAGLRHEIPEGLRGGREAPGHRHAQLRELTDHFAQRCVLAADVRQVAHAQLVQPCDIVSQLNCSRPSGSMATV